MPGSSEPTSASSPSALAPPIVASSSTWGAVIAVACRWCTFCSSAAIFIVCSMSWLSLLAGPSRPRPTVTPSRSSRGTGATPEARIMLETGLCATATRCSRSRSHVGVVEPDAVRGEHLRVQQPGPGRVLDRADAAGAARVGDLLAHLVQVDVQPRGVPQQLDGRPDQLVRGGRHGGQPDPEPAPVGGRGRLPQRLVLGQHELERPRVAVVLGPVRDVAAQAELGQGLHDAGRGRLRPGRVAEHVGHRGDPGQRHLGALEQRPDVGELAGQVRLDRADDVDEPLPERVRLADAGDQALGEVPVGADRPGVRMPVPSPTTSASGKSRRSRSVRPDRGDPLAGDRDRAVAQVPVRPGGEHVPGPDEKGARGGPRAPLLDGHYFEAALSPMAGLMYSLV